LGEREAGLIGAKIFARLDTPLHSVLHESAHFICMTPERRAGLDTDAAETTRKRPRCAICKWFWRTRCRGWAESAYAAIWMNGLHLQAWARRGVVYGGRRGMRAAGLVRHGLLDLQGAVTYACR